jgi:hypothetical protein
VNTARPSGKILSKLIVLFFVGLISANAQAFDQTYAAWGAFLKSNVVVKGPASTVRYSNAKKDRSQLDTFLNDVKSVSEADYQKMSDDEKKAFLINIYNAYTVDIILRHYPLKSIKDIGTFFKNTWKREEFKVFGADVSLDHIEHELARAHFNEPRFHFAFVCASIGCPQLRDEPFVATKLNAQLDEAALKYLSDKTRNRFIARENKLELSSIFKWYREDFDRQPGGLYGCVSKRITSDPAEQKKIIENKPSVEFLPYNWNLNDAR